MKKYIIKGGKILRGEVTVGGAKNVILKALVAACLTSEEVEIKNAPLISDLLLMIKIVEEIGGKVHFNGHKLKIRLKDITSTSIPLEIGAKIRTSSLFLPLLLARSRKAIIPNPGGCRIGARPIDRHIDGLKKMGAEISYYSRDGYFHAETKGLHGATYRFEKNSHTGTEALIIAGVLAKGKTIIENAALEPEVDDLINLLNKMGGKVKRLDGKKIVIDGVEELHGTSYEIMSDRNEVVTFAIASALTGGKILIKKIDMKVIKTFLDKFAEAGGKWEENNSFVRFYTDRIIKSTSVVTSPYPGFMTDWQGPWAIFMTQADEISVIHEAIYENRFGYIEELKKMGAKIDFFNPIVSNPKNFYNFNLEDDNVFHAVRIYGKQNLHEAILNISDLRAGATLVLAALIAKGETIIYGVEHVERGYEDFSKRLKALGADIKVAEEKT